MAGLKETPRQKMIGMMYLVLTAMLALQVSSALIEKFTLLNRSLESANTSANDKNQRQVESIKAEAGKKPGLYNDIVIKADQVRKVTNAMIAEVEALKQEIVVAGDGFDEEMNIKNPKEEEKVAILMVGSGGKGKAYELKDKLNKFVTDLTQYADKGTTFPALALDGKDDPIASRNSEQKNKDFAEMNFAQTPVPAALAVLSQKQSEIRRYEGIILDQLAAKVGAKELKFDKIFGMVSAKSNTVVAGTPFEAEMFIAASSSAITPRMSFNGTGVPVEDGKAKIKFIAQGGQYDAKGLAQKTYTGSISYNDPSGLAKTITVTGEYFVAKPTYNILTASLPGLFFRCANKLDIVSPGLGALWQPNFSATGAEVSPGGGGKVTVVPNAASVVLNINNQGQLLGQEKFKVQRVPKPEILLTCNGGAVVDERKGMPATQMRSVEVNCIPNESFKITNPEDARFRATSITINLVRGTKRVNYASFEKAGSIGSLAQQAQAGDRYVIEIEGIKRMNFKGEVEDMGMGKVVKTVYLQ
jgi:gliding motility-associated protein GldM